MEHILKQFNKYQPTKSSSLKDFADKISLFFVALLIAASLIITQKTYDINPMQCFTAEYPSGENMEKYLEAYIWSQGTIPKNVVPKRIPDRRWLWNKLFDEHRIDNYQWIPFLLILQAGLFYLPILFWDKCCERALRIDLVSLFDEARKTLYKSEDDARKSVLKVADNIELILKRKEKRSGFISKIYRRLVRIFSESRSNLIFSLYITTKMISIITCFVQIALMYFVLGLNFSFLFNITNHEASLVFPTHAFSFINDIITSGFYNNILSECILSINMINDKLYAGILVSVFIMVIIHSMCLCLWSSRVWSTSANKSRVKKLFKIKGLEVPNKNDLNRFIEGFLKTDGVFIMHMLERNAGDLVSANVMHELWLKHEMVDTILPL